MPTPKEDFELNNLKVYNKVELTSIPSKEWIEQHTDELEKKRKLGLKKYLARQKYPHTKEKIFQKYEIDESEKGWSPMSDAANLKNIFVLMKKRLPKQTGESDLFILDFLGKCKDEMWYKTMLSNQAGFEEMVSTAKRFVCLFSEKILEEIQY